MNFGPEFLQLLLVNDAEVLLLVHNDQTKVAELDLLAEQRMCTDNDIDVAACQPLPSLGHFLRADEARHLPDLDRQTVETLRKCFEVLTGKKRRRHDNGNLIARHGGDESRTQRHFGLAETDVSTDEPIHRSSASQVFENGFDC